MSRRDTTIPTRMPVSSHHSASTGGVWCGPARSAIGSPAYGAKQQGPGAASTAPVMVRTLEGGSDVEQSSPCIEWSGGRDDCGYGRTTLNGRKAKAHRVVWQEANGPIPQGMEVCHTCDNPPCVNLDHLWLGTHAENMADMAAKGRSRAPHGDDHWLRLRPGAMRGTRNGRAKLADADITAIRARLVAGETKASLARAFGVSESAVRFVANGGTWSHIS